MKVFQPLMLVLGIAAAGTAGAQGSEPYPARPVTVIVQTAGGPIDREVRLYAEKMGTVMGKPFVVDYKPGAGGVIATTYVFRAPADGYNLLSVSTGFTVFPAFNKDLPFDTLRDFAPVSLLSNRTPVLVASLAFPPKTFPEYITYTKANPGKANLGDSGAGSIGHLAGVWLHSVVGTDVTNVHFKGVTTQLQDLITGRVDVGVMSLEGATPMLKAGKIRVLANLSDRRSRVLPNVPTVAELGYPQYGFSNWLGFSVRAGTPPAVISALAGGFAKVVKLPDVAGPLQADGTVLVGSTPEEFRKLIAVETQRWSKLVQDANIKLEE